MISDKENRWWNIFIPREISESEGACPGFLMDKSRTWHKELLDLYCPCRSDCADATCQLLVA